MRLVISAAAVVCTYYAYIIAVSNSNINRLQWPIFTSSFAMLILKEKISFQKWMFLLLGYFGVLVIPIRAV